MKKIFSIILSLVILVTSMGFTVSSHICGGKRVKTEIGLIESDVSCGMERAENNCAEGEQMKSNCCQDDILMVQMDEDYSQKVTNANFSSDFVFVFVAVLCDVLPSTTVQKIFYNDYSPPPLIKDIPVLVQSFLI